MKTNSLAVLGGEQYERDERDYIDRRAAERYQTDLKCTLLIAGDKFPVAMRDISVYGMGICARGSGIEDNLQKQQVVSIEWRFGELINASVVWSFKGRFGLLLRPALEKNHPLLVKVKSESST